jgi:hypothetical protein
MRIYGPLVYKNKNRGGVLKRQFAVLWNTQYCAGERSKLLKGPLYGIVNAVVSAADVFHNRIMSKETQVRWHNGLVCLLTLTAVLLDFLDLCFSVAVQSSFRKVSTFCLEIHVSPHREAVVRIIAFYSEKSERDTKPGQKFANRDFNDFRSVITYYNTLEYITPQHLLPLSFKCTEEDNPLNGV